MRSGNIRPVINEGEYIGLRGLIAHRMPETVVIKELPALFVVHAHKYFKMKIIARFLGISVKGVYRLIEKEVAYGKISMLVFHLFNSYDYLTFVESCRKLHIIVRKDSEGK
jgi:hypothetical protein